MAAPLENFTFVFTGDLEMAREDARSRVLLLGARVTTAVSSKTTHLVVGKEPGPKKLEKAKELEIKILGEEEFVELLKKEGGQVEHKMPSAIQNGDVSLKHSLPWAEKYRPKTANEFVGNKQVISQLESFLKNKTGRRGVLLSGPPGIGKSTAALLVSQICGFQPIEFNASDIRNKKAVSENIGALLGTSSVLSNRRPRVVIMDEVDGMTSDRGGIPELVRIIKQTQTPIICICNDRQHMKMKTLANNCLDLRFRKPDSSSILKRAKEVLGREGVSINEGMINDIISKSNGDLRFVMNGLQTVSGAQPGAAILQKSVNKSIFELALEMFHRGSISSKMDLFFEEYDLLPLFVHENYLKGDGNDVVKAAESISMADVVDRHIHGPEQDWSLLPYFGFYGCVYPSQCRRLASRIDFPSFLGQNSRRSRLQRVIETLSRHCRVKMSFEDMRLYAMRIFTTNFTSALASGNFQEALNVLIQFDFTKEDILGMIEIVGESEYKAIPAKYKSAFSREYNKLNRKLPYSSVEISEEPEE